MAQKGQVKKSPPFRVLSPSFAPPPSLHLSNVFPGFEEVASRNSHPPLLASLFPTLHCFQPILIYRLFAFAVLEHN